MKSVLGNLAIVCSRRKDCLLKIYGGMVEVYTGEGIGRELRFCCVDDEKAIKELIEFLNFGKEVNKCLLCKLKEDSENVEEKD